MKTISLILLSLMSIFSFGQCDGIYGDNPKAKFRYLDSLKNRSNLPDTAPVVMQIDSFLYTKNFPLNQFTEIGVFLFKAEVTGPESCNCHSKNRSDYDYHLTCTRDSIHTGRTDRIICEITPRLRGSMDIKTIKKMVGHYVTIRGYLFDDIEHQANSFIDNPTGINDWRLGTREIHPVIYIAIWH